MKFENLMTFSQITEESIRLLFIALFIITFGIYCLNIIAGQFFLINFFLTSQLESIFMKQNIFRYNIANLRVDSNYLIEKSIA